MANFVLVYTGGSGMAQTPEEQEKAMAAWGAWFGELGSAVVEIGNPFGSSTAVTAGGTTGAATTGLGGYSVIEADTIDEAVEIAKTWPGVDQGWITMEVRPVIEMG